MPSVKVNAKYQITLPPAVVKELNIQKGDSLLVEVQDGVVVLMPCPKRHTDYLQGLHSEIWKDIDIQKYLNGERDSWEKAGNNQRSHNR
jgi:AbrB family looped-hinge helix DNA binding protein